MTQPHRPQFDQKPPMPHDTGVGVMLVAGIAWMLAASLRKPSDH